MNKLNDVCNILFYKKVLKSPLICRRKVLNFYCLKKSMGIAREDLGENIPKKY